ncbi:MAG: tRNA (adenosine(37)-N6)-threonylcarbamoyltransferase complex ATPase subunit type 1 TsaE [Clostridia bacterium]|nr:tRNA (adenosine(37)-N6)-threonylcarbamoyltransferase complex ATPase subunit type 1 TsaE [Clostridia bacterium]
MKTKRYVFCSTSEEMTEQAGAALAPFANGIICIEGDLGSGKTILVKGLAKGLGINDYITSPTFNIINIYEEDGFVFNHMDAYRMTEPSMLHDIGFEEMVESADVTAIEWADLIMDEIGGYDIRIRMSRGSSDNKRLIMVEAPCGIIDEYAGRVR